MNKTYKIIIIFFCSLSLSLSFGEGWGEAFAQSWSDVDGGLGCPAPPCDAASMYVWNNKLYVGGGFTTAGAINAFGIATWDGFKWDSLGNGMSGAPYSYLPYNGGLCVGGWFDGFGGGVYGIPNTDNLAKWDGTTWSSVSVANPDGPVRAIQFKNELIVAGGLWQVGSTVVRRVAKFNGTTWSSVGGGVTGSFERVNCMAVYNNELYVGGLFSYAGGVLSQYIARWNGTKWDSVGAAFPLNYYVTSMVTDTIANVLYVAGGFDMIAGGIQAIGVAKWDGSKWSAVGTDTLFGTLTLEMYHNELYAAGGNVVKAQNGEQLNNIYRWDGTEWHSVLGGANSTVESLEVYQDTLYVGGFFDKVDTLPVNYIAKYYAPPPPCDTITAGFTYTIDGTGNVQFTDTSKNAVNYFWSFGDGTISTLQNPNHSYANGSYTAQLVATSSCMRDTFKVNFTITGVKEFKVESLKFKVYPNPSKGELTIATEQKGIFTASITTAQGREVARKSFEREIKLTLPGAAKGVYTVKVCGLTPGPSPGGEGSKCHTEKLVME